MLPASRCVEQRTAAEQSYRSSAGVGDIPPAAWPSVPGRARGICKGSKAQAAVPRRGASRRASAPAPEAPCPGSDGSSQTGHGGTERSISTAVTETLPRHHRLTQRRVLPTDRLPGRGVWENKELRHSGHPGCGFILRSWTKLEMCEVSIWTMLQLTPAREGAALVSLGWGLRLGLGSLASEDGRDSVCENKLW